MSLNTATTISGEGGRWKPMPLVRVSELVHAAAIVLLAVEPQAWPWALGLLAANHVVLACAILSPNDQLLGPNLSSLPASAAARGEICLTFDDGPDPEVTPRVLDLLDRFRAKGSFFCIGERAAAHPELVRGIARRGHSVENHSYHHHMAFSVLGTAWLKPQVEAAQETLTLLAGRPPAFFRAPAGFRSPLLHFVLSNLGLRYVSWTRRGFDTVSRDPRRILRRLTRGLAAGDVLLLHDSAPIVLDVLPALLGELAARGLRSVSLATACGNEPQD
jgi:peptidoglycan/xylan/chitin deacetylase (PgdA/CDA1 family)